MKQEIKKIMDPTTGKKIYLASLEKLEPFMNSEKQAQMFINMNRKQRRKFLAQHKKQLSK